MLCKDFQNIFIAKIRKQLLREGWATVAFIRKSIALKGHCHEKVFQINNSGDGFDLKYELPT
jgi:hypothetical protein